MWVHVLGNECIPVERGKLFGESQERCRPETMVGQASRGVSRREGQETLRAERSGSGSPRVVDSRCWNVLKGAEAHERSCGLRIAARLVSGVL
jgi:hypothetical protein